VSHWFNYTFTPARFSLYRALVWLSGVLVRSVDVFILCGGFVLVVLVAFFVRAQYAVNRSVPTVLPVMPPPSVVSTPAPSPVRYRQLPVRQVPGVRGSSVSVYRLAPNMRCVGGVVVLVAGNSYSTVSDAVGPVRCSGRYAQRR
jgi:hypothetical protein